MPSLSIFSLSTRRVMPRAVAVCVWRSRPVGGGEAVGFQRPDLELERGGEVAVAAAADAVVRDVDVRDVDGVDPVSLIAYDKVMVTVDAVKKFEEMLG